MRGSPVKVIQAINVLKRYKVAGVSGLIHFFSDAQGSDGSRSGSPLARSSFLIATRNELLARGEPLLQGLIDHLTEKRVTLMTAACSQTIALLQLGLKVYSKTITTRVQRVLKAPMGESQQGFVDKRQMRKTEMMLVALLTTAKNEALTAARSRAIVRLDIAKLTTRSRERSSCSWLSCAFF